MKTLRMTYSVIVRNPNSWNAATGVLRSMVADMRRQGWSLSNESADQMVAKLSAEILALPGIGETR